MFQKTVARGGKKRQAHWGCNVRGGGEQRRCGSSGGDSGAPSSGTAGGGTGRCAAVATPKAVAKQAKGTGKGKGEHTSPKLDKDAELLKQAAKMKAELTKAIAGRFFFF